jgi:hypothetical protein
LRTREGASYGRDAGNHHKPLTYHELSPAKLSLWARIAGVIRRPRSTFAAVISRPAWAGVLAVTFAVSLISSAAFLMTDVGKQALVDQWERTSIAFGRPVDDARYAELQDLSRYSAGYGAVTTVATRPLATLALAALVYAIFAARGAAATFAQAVAVVAHAGIILAVRDLVALPFNYVRESIASPVTLVRLFSMLDEASPVARFFALIDVFVLWWVVVLALGIAMLYGIRVRTATLTLIGAYVAIALLLAGTMAILGGTA